MYLDKFSELELSRLLKNLVLDSDDISLNYKEEAFELIDKFNTFPSTFEFEENIRSEQKVLDKMFGRLLDITQNFVRKIKVYFEDSVSTYDKVIHNNFYQLSIDKFIEYAYEVSKFLEDHQYELMHVGINQAKIDNYNAQLFDLRKINNEFIAKVKEYEDEKKIILDKIKFKIEELSKD